MEKIRALKDWWTCLKNNDWVYLEIVNISRALSVPVGPLEVEGGGDGEGGEAGGREGNHSCPSL